MEISILLIVTNLNKPSLKSFLEIDISDDGSDVDLNDDFADISDVDEIKASTDDLNDLDKLIHTTKDKAEGTKPIYCSIWG